jgi:hypothetical protein
MKLVSTLSTVMLSQMKSIILPSSVSKVSWDEGSTIDFICDNITENPTQSESVAPIQNEKLKLGLS